MKEVYELLEEKMLNTEELVSVVVEDIGEPLVPIIPTANLFVSPNDEYMKDITGDAIFVRKRVAYMVFMAATKIRESMPGAGIEVVYGYRPLERQTELYDKIFRELTLNFPEDEGRVVEETHRMIALPEVSGHPTGGAIDLQPVIDGRPLDMGTKIWEFEKDSYTFSPFISREAWKNRQLFRKAMVDVGFAPFDGEWWHYSYGDREWAAYYGKPNAIYGQLAISALENNGRMRNI